MHNTMQVPMRPVIWSIPMSRQLKAAEASTAALGQGRADVTEVVAAVIDDVRRRGDDAVRQYSEKFDHWSPESFRLSPEQIDEIMSRVPDEVLDDLRTVQANVRGFAQLQLESMREIEVETQPGVFLGQRHLPVAASGAYVPGGRYPLTASAHMTVVTAKVAGVDRVTTCTPPIRGEIPAATVAAMPLAGADDIFLLGGVQAVAAMALGTETIGKVDLLAGPGNAYVAEAKRQLFGEVGIDLFAGPTEILVVADDGADPFVVAVDLLSQAEHGPDSPAVLITTSEDVARAAMAHIDRLLPDMPTNDMAGPAWRDHGQVHVVEDLDEAYRLADGFASEHVQILTGQPREALARMRNYGALFLGEGTCVSYGDKVIGTNHVLPTRGAARYTGGLWVGKYLRTVTYQEVTDRATSAALGELCGRASRIELFEGHARSGDVRAAKYAGAELPWAPEIYAPSR
jgi:sulfopropanediol 3-dehydrogenase